MRVRVCVFIVYYVSMIYIYMYIFIYICFPARSHRSACGFLSHWVGVVVLSAILTIIFCVRTGVDFRPTVFPSFISAASLAVPLQAYHTQSRLMKEAVVDEEQHGGGGHHNVVPRKSYSQGL